MEITRTLPATNARPNAAPRPVGKSGGLAAMFAALGSKQEPGDDLVDALAGPTNYDKTGQARPEGAVTGVLLDLLI